MSRLSLKSLASICTKPVLTTWGIRNVFRAQVFLARFQISHSHAGGHGHVCVYVYGCTDIHMYTSICMYVCVCVYVCVCNLFKQCINIVGEEEGV